MNPKQLKEILAIHADEMLQGHSPSEEEAFDFSPEDEAELVALFGVAERVSSTLKPVAPGRNFENQLKRELLTTAHLRQAEGYTLPNPERDLLILTSVAGLLLALAGLLITLKIRKII
ncbi:MAG: hypothetical protein AB1801_08775 [Chloroflexota bacterium]